MTTRTDSGKPEKLIESRDDLLATFARGEKPADRWTIGTEHEKFVYRCADHRAPSYDEPGGIRDLLGEMQAFGWQPVEENGRPGVLVIARDDGPGISDVLRAAIDAPSDCGGVMGLRAMKCLVDEFEIESRAGHGTRVAVKKWKA